jgi:hypothetical protein
MLPELVWGVQLAIIHLVRMSPIAEEHYAIMVTWTYDIADRTTDQLTTSQAQ